MDNNTALFFSTEYCSMFIHYIFVIQNSPLIYQKNIRKKRFLCWFLRIIMGWRGRWSAEISNFSGMVRTGPGIPAYMTIIILQTLCMRKVCQPARQKFPFSLCSMRDDKERRSLWPLTEQKESGENLYLTGYKFASTCLGFPNWMTRRQALLNANEKNWTHLSITVICITVFSCHFFQPFL